MEWFAFIRHNMSECIYEILQMYSTHDCGVVRVHDNGTFNIISFNSRDENGLTAIVENMLNCAAGYINRTLYIIERKKNPKKKTNERKPYMF